MRWPLANRLPLRDRAIHIERGASGTREGTGFAAEHAKREAGHVACVASQARLIPPAGTRR